MASTWPAKTPHLAHPTLTPAPPNTPPAQHSPLNQKINYYLCKMEIFYSRTIEGGICELDPEESVHCVKVLRHREGDEICVIDGQGTFYDCVLTDASPKCATARVVRVQPCWGAHDYNLTMAVCPTKNIDRYEWFAEKATEIGIDRIVPTIGEHSERRVLKTERLKKILLSATKQSLKGAIPEIDEPTDVSGFIRSCRNSSALKLIAYCFEDDSAPRRSITEILGTSRDLGTNGVLGTSKEIIVLIGPEGDFSREEARLAMECGFIPVHLGESRLRTETAALTAVTAVYLAYI